jgi:hypothetical protein
MTNRTTRTSPPPLAERRPERRKRSLLGGLVVYSEGRHSFVCTIRNMTAKGARIAFANGQSPPSSFVLVNLRDHLVHKAHIIWASATEAGLALEGGVAGDALPSDLAYLRRFLGR